MRLLLLACLALVFSSQAATTLVHRYDQWQIHKGTNAAQLGWASISDSALNSEWFTGNGGIGYGDPAMLGQTTVLNDMQGAYGTVYTRRTFNVSSAIPAGARLQFTIDYDDAYVAYLDGVEIARSTNAPTGDPDHLALATSRHEASCCDAPTNPATTIDLGFVGNRLGVGPHILAIRGFNDDLASSDFHLFADLAVLLPGECAPNTLCENLTWSPSDGVLVIATNLTLATGVTLTIEAGSEIRFWPNGSLLAGPNSTIDIRGTAAAPVHFRPAITNQIFGEIAAYGTNSFLTIRHAEVVGGNVQFRNGATGLMEDCYVHHFKNGAIPIAGCMFAKSVTVRRCHFDTYHETLWEFTPTVIEDSLFENADNPSSDALDFDGAPPGSVIRRCTFRNGPQSNTDAIDIGDGSSGVLIESCLMINFPNDKGVSIGEGSSNIVIRNCLVYGCDSGVAVKDNCTAIISNCIFVQNDYGFRNYNKADPAAATGGGHILESFNNILWNNTNTISLSNGATALADHSDFSALAWPGEGNLSIDPLFRDAANRDYQLALNSSLLNAGRNGATMGVIFPVGAPMAPSHPGFEVIEKTAGGIHLRFWMDSLKGYFLQSTTQIGGPWQNTDLGLVTRPRLVDMTLPISETGQFFKLVAQP